MTRKDLQRELDGVQAEIDAAYWAFTRQARAKPPVLAVPEAYKRRRELQTLLAESFCPDCGQDDCPGHVESWSEDLGDGAQR